MLNPGKAKFVTNTLSENMEVVGEVSLDRTMQAIVELVKKLHGTDEVERIQGQIKLYNLFPLQNAKADEAIDDFEELWLAQEPLIIRLPKNREELLGELESSPWELLGWGCGRSPKARKTVPVHRTIHFNSIIIQAALMYQGRLRMSMQLSFIIRIVRCTGTQ